MGTDEPTQRAPVSPAQAAMLKISRGPNAGTRFILDKSVIEVGRGPDADIVLDDITVGRRHARLEWSSTGGRITDLGSLNGTYVNQERVHSAPVGPADDIQIGKFRLEIQIAVSSEPDPDAGTTKRKC